MKDERNRDLPQTDPYLPECAELAPVVAEVHCLEEHFQLTDEAMYDSLLREPTDEELREAFSDWGEIDDPFAGMNPSDFEDEEEIY